MPIKATFLMGGIIGQPASAVTVTVTGSKPGPVQMSGAKPDVLSFTATPTLTVLKG